MAGEIIDEAYVEIKSKIDPSFTSDVRKSVKDGLKPVASDVEKQLKPVSDTVKESISDAFQDAADAVEDAMDRVSRDVDKTMKGVEKDSDAAGRAIEQIENKIGELRAEAAKKIELDVDADTKDVDSKINRLQRNLRTLQAVRPKVEIEVDTDRGEQALDGITRQTSRFSDGVKGALGGVTGALDGAANGAAGLLAKMGPMLAIGAALAPVLLAVAAAAAAMASAVVLAAGSLVTLAGVGASLGLAFATVKVGTSGMTEALKASAKAEQELAETGKVSAETQKELDAAMRGLSPAARQVVKALSEVKSQFSEIRQSVQQNLFEGQARNMRDLATAVLPSVDSALNSVAKTLNKGADSFTKFFTEGEGAGQLDAILTNLSDTFDRLLPAFGNIGAGLLNLFVPASADAKTLADSITDITERFHQWTERITESGEFQDFLERARAAASAVFRVLGQVGGLIGDVFGGDAADKGVALFDKISDSIAKVRKNLATPAGQEGLAATFEHIETVVGTVMGVLGQLAPVITGAFSTFGPILQQYGPILESVAGTIKDVLLAAFEQMEPSIARAAEALGQLGAFLKENEEPIRAFATVLGTVVGALAGFAIDFIVDVFTNIAAVVTGLVEKFNQLVGVGAAIIGFFASVGTAVFNTSVAIGNFVGGLVAGMQRGIAVIVGFVQQAISRFAGFRASVVAAFQAVVASIQEKLASARATINGWITTVVAWFAALPGRVRSALSSVVGNVRSIFSNVFSAARSIVSSGISDVVAKFQAVPGKIAALAGRMLSAGKSIGSSVINGIKSGLSSAAGFAGDIASSIKSAINSTLGLPFTIDGPGPLPSFTIPAFARGGVIDKETIARVGEAGREVIVPVTNATRAAQLVVESGLADIPQVQNAILRHLQASPMALQGSGPLGLDTASLDVLRRSGKPSGAPTTTMGGVPSTPGSTRVVNNNQTQNFILPPVIDPDALAEAFAARVAEDSER